jgi:adenosylcobinamide-GDP ribazoletransferase
MRGALAFLTPLGRATTPDARTFDWFPIVGALLGLVLGGLWWGADRLWPPVVVAALVVGGDLALTGLLHFDGLVDTADGLLPHLERERRLEVMAAPDVGAFGVGVGAGALLARFAAIASMTPSVVLLGALWCMSRTVMAVAARRLPYARERGLATAFGGGSASRVAAVGTALAVALGLLATQPGRGAALAAVAAVAAGGAAVVAFAHRRLGGFTGDVLGAAGLVGETFGLVVAAAKW